MSTLDLHSVEQEVVRLGFVLRARGRLPLRGELHRTEASLVLNVIERNGALLVSLVRDSSPKKETEVLVKPTVLSDHRELQALVGAWI